jgi:hypothetical protein
MTPWLAGTLGGGLLLTVLGGILGWLVPIAMPAMPPGIAAWALAANVLIAAVLTALAVRSRWTGWRLAAALFLVLFMVKSFTSLIEAAFFDLFIDRATALALLAHELVVALVAAPSLVALTGRMRSRPTADEPALAPVSWPVPKFVACSALYLVLYFVFGLIIYPYVHEFYAQKILPGPLAIIAMQLLVRGPIFVAIVLLVVRMVRGTPATRALLAALVMSVVGGVAPLMVPNPFMPDAVRFVHFFEVVTENFIFGWVTGWLFAPRPIVPKRLATAA